MQEILASIIDDCYNLKVLIVKKINLEYFDFAENSIIHDDNLF